MYKPINQSISKKENLHTQFLSYKLQIVQRYKEATKSLRANRIYILHFNFTT